MASLKSIIEGQFYLRQIRDNVRAWLIPAVAVGMLGSAYALVRPSVWIATQDMIVREEIVGELSSRGRFDNTDERKAAQETILQVARNRKVVINSLHDVMPEEIRSSQGFPKESLIRRWQDAINVRAAKGSEFGDSDMIYLQVKGSSAAQAVENTKIVAEHLGQELNELRKQRSDSVIRELEGTIKLAVANRDNATSRLEAIEREIGSDLGELRTMNRSGSGESNLRTSLNQIKSELRNTQSEQTQQIERLEFLRTVVKEPEKIVAIPNGVLAAQPTLRRLKDGLVDTQLRLADLMGKMNAAHPSVKAAHVALDEIHSKIRTELKTAIRSAEAELDVNQALESSYEQQLQTVKDRLSKLASMRASYENLLADVEHRTSQVEEAQRALADARASHRAGETSSLITFVDEPNPSDKPIGPGRITLIASSWIGGLSLGLGLLFLFSQPDDASSSNRFGRRSTDRVTHNYRRRAEDQIDDNSQTDRRTGETIVPGPPEGNH